MRSSSLFALLCLFLSFAASAQQAPSAGKAAIESVLKDMENFRRQEGKRDSAAQQPLGSNKEEDFLRRYQFYQTMEQKLNAIGKGKLSFDDEINLELLQHNVRNELSNYTFKAYLNPILSDEGFHTALARRSNAILSTNKDAESYLAILKDMPRYVGENLDLMRRGLALGISQPKVILNGYETTYTQHIVQDPEASMFWKPFSKRPVGINEGDWTRYTTEAKTLIQKEVVTSFQKIKTFFDTEYLPKTRTTLGASHFPKGNDYYEDRVRHYTSTNLSSEEVYQIGLKEVARIRKEMDAVIRQVAFTGSFKEFIEQLRNDPKFQPTSGEALLKEASFIAKKIDGKLPLLFGRLPRQPYTVEPVPAHLAPTYTTGRYSGAPISSKRSGQYWVNTFNLPSRTLYTLEALTLHEAVPGHHLQTALAQELPLPPFRRNIYINAFGEGWGLYSEYLGHEMGFYKDPYSLFGRLTYDMWRACRLVIDVAVHTKNWTREQAVSYLADNTALSIHEVNTEINRYISWPGQALAYKIGEIKIKEMREKATAALGQSFDIRSFHDMVLSNGSVTLSILERMTARYIEEELAKKKKEGKEF
jgi:uncharacterized protein (DUF885 family)